MRRRYSYLILLVALAAALVYSLTLATNSGSPLSEYFWWLIAAGGLIVTILLAMLLRYGWLLLRHNRHNMLGSRLTRRLALMFTLIAVLPGLFLFGVSAQFISYSINSWFGNDTAQALESSLTLSKSALDNTLDNTIEQAAALQVEIISRTSMGGTAAEALRLSGETARFSQVGLYNPADGTTELISNPAAPAARRKRSGGRTATARLIPQRHQHQRQTVRPRLAGPARAARKRESPVFQTAYSRQRRAGCRTD